MKYEMPELTALAPAVVAIQSGANKSGQTTKDGNQKEEPIAYADWED